MSEIQRSQLKQFLEFQQDGKATLSSVFNA